VCLSILPVHLASNLLVQGSNKLLTFKNLDKLRSSFEVYHFDCLVVSFCGLTVAGVVYVLACYLLPLS